MNSHFLMRWTALPMGTFSFSQRHVVMRDSTVIFFLCFQVVDFLVAAEELCQKGFTGDDAEIALTFNNDDAKKVLTGTYNITTYTFINL